MITKTHATAHPAIAALALCLTASCDQSLGEKSDLDADSPTETQSNSDDLRIDTDSGSSQNSDTDTSQGPSARMSGTWGMLLSASSKQVGIPLVKTQILSSRNYFLVEASPDGPTRIRTEEKLCGLYVELETWLNKTIIPDRFIEHSGVIERTIDLSSSEPGAPWISDDVYEVRGARLADPVRDPLPPPGSSHLNETQPCETAPIGSECDQDEDGHPGMTTILAGALSCELYVAQRWHSALAGAIVDANHIAGPLSSAATQQTILATNSNVCKQGNMQTLEVIDKCPEHFYFKMVRLPDHATCDDVMALTSCDEKLETCGGQINLPLNPNVDDPSSCS
ncbi:MAG: hypothetical protein MUC50_17385 [Myxococcota bacterium]|nr:hypothetical protein [Myxococcota bacterium]